MIESPANLPAGGRVQNVSDRIVILLVIPGAADGSGQLGNEPGEAVENLGVQPQPGRLITQNLAIGSRESPLGGARRTRRWSSSSFCSRSAIWTAASSASSPCALPDRSEGPAAAQGPRRDRADWCAASWGSACPSTRPAAASSTQPRSPPGSPLDQPPIVHSSRAPFLLAPPWLSSIDVPPCPERLPASLLEYCRAVPRRRPVVRRKGSRHGREGWVFSQNCGFLNRGCSFLGTTRR